MKLIPLFLHIVIVPSYVLGLKCYKCVSVIDSNCDSEPKQERFIHECLPEIEAEGDLFECGIGTASVRVGFKKFNVKARGCVPKAMGKEACKKMLSIGRAIQVITCNTCETNLCNSASSLMGSRMKFYILLSLSLIIFYATLR